MPSCGSPSAGPRIWKLANAVRPILKTERLTAVLLPDAAWARRVIGIYANHLVNSERGRICAVLVPNGHSKLSVSLRVPEGYGVAAEYYLNVMAGPRRAWRFRNHPDHDWIARRDA